MHRSSGIPPEPSEPDLWQRFPDRRRLWTVMAVAMTAATGSVLAVDPTQPPGPVVIAGWAVAALAVIWLNAMSGWDHWRRGMRRPFTMMGPTWLLVYRPPRGAERSFGAWLAWGACCVTSTAYVVSFFRLFIGIA